MATDDRMVWPDVAKGLGIIAVVYAHVASGQLRNLIFLFHMPLFFFLSGYFHRATPAGEMLRKKASRLLRPYASFLVLVAVVVVTMQTYSGGGGDLAAWAERFQRLVPEMLYGGQRLHTQFGAFWFVTCLFLAHQLLNAALRWSGGPATWRCASAVAGYAAAAYAISWLDVATPWNAGVAPMAVVFMWFGQLYRRAPGRAGIHWISVGFSVAVLVLARSTDLRLAFDMKSYGYGIPVLGVLLATSLTIVFVAGCRLIAKVDLAAGAAAAVGRASITILFLHQLVHFGIRDAIADDLVVTAWATAVPLVVHYALRSWSVTRFLFLGESLERAGRGGTPPGDGQPRRDRAVTG